MIISPGSQPLIRRRKKSVLGFTLIELVVALAVVGLLLGAILTPLATQFRVRTLKEAERNLKEVREALIGFAMTNSRLPCPDDPADGVDGSEDYTNNVSPTRDTCSTYDGYLPWVTLGVSSADVWGRLYRYGVNQEFIQSTSPGTPCVALDDMLGLCDAANLNVIDRASNKSPITLTSNAAAVIVSLGSNGYGGRDTDGNTLVAPTGADELENTNGDVNFVRRNYSLGAGTCSDTGGTTPLCEYDDLVTWIPESVLKSRLVEAGRLP